MRDAQIVYHWPGVSNFEYSEHRSEKLLQLLSLKSILQRVWALLCSFSVTVLKYTQSERRISIHAG
jgi:hypothetical protein